MAASQAMLLLRAVAIQNEVVTADFMEYKRFIDDAHQTAGVLYGLPESRAFSPLRGAVCA